jgi:hypothetical protein
MKLAAIPHGFRKLSEHYAWLLRLPGVDKADYDTTYWYYTIETTVGAWEGGVRDALRKSGIFDETGRGVFDYDEFMRSPLRRWTAGSIHVYCVPAHREAATRDGCYSLDHATNVKQIADNVSGAYVISLKHDYVRQGNVDWDDVKRRYPCMYSFSAYNANDH